MNRNDPREQRAYQRRLQRLRARDRKWNQGKDAYWRGLSASSRWLHTLLDDALRLAPARRNREIDDEGLDS